MVELNETTIAMGFAGLGVLFSIVWLVLGVYGIASLRQIRDSLRETAANGE